MLSAAAKPSGAVRAASLCFWRLCEATCDFQCPHLLLVLLQQLQRASQVLLLCSQAAQLVLPALHGIREKSLVQLAERELAGASCVRCMHAASGVLLYSASEGIQQAARHAQYTKAGIFARWESAPVCPDLSHTTSAAQLPCHAAHLHGVLQAADVVSEGPELLAPRVQGTCAALQGLAQVLHRALERVRGCRVGLVGACLRLQVVSSASARTGGEGFGGQLQASRSHCMQQGTPAC